MAIQMYTKQKVITKIPGIQSEKKKISGLAGETHKGIMDLLIFFQSFLSKVFNTNRNRHLANSKAYVSNIAFIRIK